jgi:hypothetical protein
LGGVCDGDDAVPVLARAIEFLIHWTAGTPEVLTGALGSASQRAFPFFLIAPQGFPGA